jgi:hypothetical protein
VYGVELGDAYIVRRRTADCGLTSIAQFGPAPCVPRRVARSTCTRAIQR